MTDKPRRPGRPPKHEEPSTAKSIMLPASYWGWLFGKYGGFATGIKKLIEQDIERGSKSNDRQ